MACVCLPVWLARSSRRRPHRRGELRLAVAPVSFVVWQSSASEMRLWSCGLCSVVFVSDSTRACSCSVLCLVSVDCCPFVSVSVCWLVVYVCVSAVLLHMYN